MLESRLLGLHGVTFRTTERVEVGPIHLQIHRRERILLRCEPEPVYAAFLSMITGEVHPIAGRLEELEPVRVQTDRHLKATISPNRTIRELLESWNLPDTIWLGQRRRSLFGVMDRLGLSPRHFRLPLKMEPVSAVHKLWALRFLASRADLLVGREVFALEDPLIREVIGLRWGDLSAAVIYAGPPERMPGPPDTVLTLEPGGAVRVEEITARPGEGPGEDSLPEGKPPAPPENRGGP